MDLIARHFESKMEARKKISAEVEKILQTYKDHSIAEPMAGGAQNLLMPRDPAAPVPAIPLFELPPSSDRGSLGSCLSTNNLPRPLHINSLPVSVKVSILSWLPGPDLGRMSGVSREWGRVGRDEALWRAVLRRDLRRWDRVSSDRDPDAFRAAYPNISSKCIYAWCRPAGSGSRSGGGSGGGGEEASSGLDWGVGLSALVSLVVGHKPRVVMFGPGLDSRTSKLVRSILSDPGHGGNQLSRFKVTGMVPGEFAGMGSGISLRFAEHNFNLVTLHSNTRRVRQGEGHQRVQDNKLFTQAGEAFQLAPAVIELCRRSQAFVFVVDATKGPAQIAQSADELSAVCCNLWSSSHAPLLVLACSRGTWSPRYEDAEPLSPSEVGRALRLGRLSNRRWLVQAGEVETLHGVRSGFQWLLSGINPVLSLAQPR